VALAISVLALVATCYQLYLQRVHNEKSVKPLVQIDLIDHKNQLAVLIRNNGLGPLMVEELTFLKKDKAYSQIVDCLDLDPKSYMHIPVTDTHKRVVLPNAHLIVFEKMFALEAEAERARVRNLLAPLHLRVRGRDIYDNPVIVERDFQWFGR
jgi:hypothetical protein